MKRLFVLNANSHGRGAVLFAWHPTGNFLATCGQNRIVNIVNRQGEPHAEIPLDGTGKCAQLEWSADGELLAVLQAGSPNITLWDANHSSVSSLDTGTKDISYICWSRAGPQLAIGTAKGNLVIYNKKTMKKVQLQGASSCATRTLMREFKSLKLLELKGGLDGIGVEISDDADGFTWKALITAPEDDPQLPLLLGLRRFAELTEHEFPAAVELELSFTKNFPFDPPFVRVVRPRFEFMTGHVTQGGSICIELLTASGWSPAYSLESLLVQLRALFVSGNAKIDTKSHLKKMAYGKKTALENFRRVAGVHGWKV